jgi:hypothetical protein
LSEIIYDQYLPFIVVDLFIIGCFILFFISDNVSDLFFLPVQVAFNAFPTLYLKVFLP